MDVSDRRMQVQLTPEAKIATEFFFIGAIFAFVDFVRAWAARMFAPPCLCVWGDLLLQVEEGLHAGYSAMSPNSSSMRSSWLYLATRSVRLGAPVLIWPALRATAMSAMVASSVSPER